MDMDKLPGDYRQHRFVQFWESCMRVWRWMWMCDFLSWGNHKNYRNLKHRQCFFIIKSNWTKEWSCRCWVVLHCGRPKQQELQKTRSTLMVPPSSPHTVSPPYTFSVSFAGNYWWDFPENIIYQAACCTKKLESCWFSFGTSAYITNSHTQHSTTVQGMEKLRRWELWPSQVCCWWLVVELHGMPLKLYRHVCILFCWTQEPFLRKVPEKVIMMCWGLAKVHLYAEILKCILYL